MAQPWTLLHYAKHLDATYKTSLRVTEMARVAKIASSIRRIRAAATRLRPAAQISGVARLKYALKDSILRKGSTDFGDFESNRLETGRHAGRPLVALTGYDNGLHPSRFRRLVALTERSKVQRQSEQIGPAAPLRSLTQPQPVRTEHSVAEASPSSTFRKRHAFADLITRSSTLANSGLSQVAPRHASDAIQYRLDRRLAPNHLGTHSNARFARGAHTEIPDRKLMQRSHGLERHINAFRQMLNTQTASFAKAANTRLGVLQGDHSFGAAQDAALSKVAERRARLEIGTVDARFASPIRPESSNSAHISGASSNALQKATSAGITAVPARGRRSALLRPTPKMTVPAQPTRTTGDSRDSRPPIVVNFSPTIVVQGGIEPGNIEPTFLQSIRQYSHELVRTINRELQKQRRATF